MTAKSLITIVLALLLTCGAASGGQQRGGGDRDDPSLWVEVRDEQGMPLKNACITLVPKEGEILFRKADGRGRVRIKKLSEGRYRVTAKVDGYEAQKKEVLMTGTTETVSFNLQPRHY